MSRYERLQINRMLEDDLRLDQERWAAQRRRLLDRLRRTLEVGQLGERGLVPLEGTNREGFPRVLRRGPRTSLLVLNGEVEYPREAR